MSLNQQSCPSLARGVRLQTDPKSGEPMLLFPEGILYLSQTAYDIVRLCDGHHPVSELVSILAEEYEAEAELLCQDVLDCLRDLYERKLVLI